MKILVTGATGMLGKSVVDILTNSKHNVLAPPHCELDTTKRSEVENFVSENHVHIAINCAAFTDVDRAEMEPLQAYKVNCLAVQNLADCVEALVHISTDYVFPGQKRKMYSDTCRPCPVNMYGITKLAGELAAQTTSFRWILRTAQLYGNDRGYVSRIAYQLAHGKDVTASQDFIGHPTYVSDLSKAIVEVVNKRPPDGIYNVVNERWCSRYKLACSVRDILVSRGKKTGDVIPLKGMPAFVKAKRPRSLILNTAKWRLAGMTPLRPWQDALEEYIK